MLRESQKKVLQNALTMLGAGVRRGNRLLREGVPEAELLKHFGDLRLLAEEMEEGLARHVGADAVLDVVEKAKARAVARRKTG